MIGSQVPFGVKPTRAVLDITKPNDVARAFDKYRPEAVLHLAALVGVQSVESNPTDAFAINILGTKWLAEACAERNVHLTYISSCAVFGDDKPKPNTETDIPHPLNVYGRTKWLGEVVAQEINPHTLVVRTGWLFGGGEPDTKFVKHCIDWCNAGTPIKAMSDRIGSPTYITDFIETVKTLMDGGETGIVHAVNSGTASYYDIALAVKELTSADVPIESVSAKDIEDPRVKRGPMEALSSEKVHLRPWREALAEYITLLSK